MEDDLVGHRTDPNAPTARSTSSAEIKQLPIGLKMPSSTSSSKLDISARKKGVAALLVSFK